MDQDSFRLQRFVEAQATTFDTALSEMREGRKRSHWMWFIFPQLRGLGRTATAQFYGIASLEEARAYLAHPLLAPRLDLVTQAVLATSGRSLHEIFGSPDDLKFHSSMTLFAIASERQDGPFRDALDRWFAGGMDAGSMALLGLSEEEDPK
ncbi:DUF1810 domain-containing protein [Bosea sp. CCNWLW174]|uniref:DUF1810 domain-containing protein n=1 Tax=unclassified Bosea (in: a-proteobacteria) TaxID=2653178 RepID=UPI0030142435